MEKPSFNEALKFWFKLGWISFGGPAGQIAIMHEFLVEKHKWISEKKFLHALNYCMLLPGPEAQQLATYTGWLLHGNKGGFAAGLLFIIPSIFILLGFSIIYVLFGDLPWINAIFNGLKPAVVAIVLLAMFKIGKRSLLTVLHYVIAILSFVAIFFLNIPFPLIILGTILIGLAVHKFAPHLLAIKNTKSNNEDSEDGFYLTSKTIIPHAAFSSKRLGKQIALFVLMWITPLLLFYIVGTDFYFWKQLSLFFSQAAFVTFGGAYAVLPYVAQQAVENFGWLTGPQMIDGLALGETTPGPLIMVLAFVGFMGAYGNTGGNLLAGSLGLLTTTYYTFLPCFLFIFGGAPLIEHTQQNKWVKALLSLITAAVTGVIANLALYFAEAVIFGADGIDYHKLEISTFGYINIGWIIISFIAMYRFKIDMLKWLGISAIFGLIIFLLQS